MIIIVRYFQRPGVVIHNLVGQFFKAGNIDVAFGDLFGIAEVQSPENLMRVVDDVVGLALADITERLWQVYQADNGLPLALAIQELGEGKKYRSNISLSFPNSSTPIITCSRYRWSVSSLTINCISFAGFFDKDPSTEGGRKGRDLFGVFFPRENQSIKKIIKRFWSICIKTYNRAVIIIVSS